MKWLTLVVMGVYISGSLACGEGKMVSCCEKNVTALHQGTTKSCHSSNQATESRESPISLDSCCCSYSADLPKSLDIRRIESPSPLIHMMIGYTRDIATKELGFSSGIGLPPEFKIKDFAYSAFQALAPPRIA